MSDWHRRLSAVSWLIVAGVLVRAGSGGGGLASIRYVAQLEPPLSYAAGVIVLVASLCLVLAFARSRSAVLPVASAVASVPTAAYGGYLALSDHYSALILGAAAIGAFALAAPAARRELARQAIGRTSRRDRDEVGRDR